MICVSSGSVSLSLGRLCSCSGSSELSVESLRLRVEGSAVEDDMLDEWHLDLVARPGTTRSVIEVDTLAGRSAVVSKPGTERSWRSCRRPPPRGKQPSGRRVSGQGPQRGEPLQATGADTQRVNGRLWRDGEMPAESISVETQQEEMVDERGGAVNPMFAASTKGRFQV